MANLELRGALDGLLPFSRAHPRVVHDELDNLARGSNLFFRGDSGSRACASHRGRDDHRHRRDRYVGEHGLDIGTVVARDSYRVKDHGIDVPFV